MASVELKAVKDLFGQQFFIPSYQRGYRWGATQIKELLEDLYTFKKEDKEGNKLIYCLQPIIVKKKKYSDKWELVDGQQRLTALWLISALYTTLARIFEPAYKRQDFEYKLEYENKEIFTSLFEKIDEFVENGSLTKIAEGHFKEEKDNSIDCRNLIESMEYISNYKYNEATTGPAVLNDIFQKLRQGNVQIIWYELDETEDAIQTFTNVNANKIALTNAELIKAVLLHSCEKDGTNKVQTLALQWEEIEKGLNNDNFWEFIVNKKNNINGTRIDYLFEIWCAIKENEQKNENDDRYTIFRTVNKYLINEDIWKKIQEIYETLTDWYNNYYYYHTIGFLIAEDEQNTKLIKDLYNIYNEKSKTEFRKEILNRIKKCTKLENYADSPESLNSCFIGTEYNDNNKEKLRKILLLYSISMLVNANNIYERFPFALYKTETWDIEHINPQTPKNDSDNKAQTDQDKREWLESYQELLREDSNEDTAELLKDIDSCNNNELSTFEDVSQRIMRHYKIKSDSINSLGNLVLLDYSTNRSYKNVCFFNKRKRILEIERSSHLAIVEKRPYSNNKNENDKKYKYIPIGTKWVFLKGYENSKSLIVWGETDMNDYLKDMAKNIYNMLNGENK